MSRESVLKTTELKIKCIGIEDTINRSQPTVFGQAIFPLKAFRHEATPISKKDPLACAASVSSRDGALRICMKKFDEARTAVENALRSK